MGGVVKGNETLKSLGAEIQSHPREGRAGPGSCCEIWPEGELGAFMMRRRVHQGLSCASGVLKLLKSILELSSVLLACHYLLQHATKRSLGSPTLFLNIFGSP